MTMDLNIHLQSKTFIINWEEMIHSLLEPLLKKCEDVTLHYLGFGMRMEIILQ